MAGTLPYGRNTTKKTYQSRGQPRSWYQQQTEWFDRARTYQINNTHPLVQNPFTFDPDDIVYGEYDEDRVEFNNETQASVTFNIAFTSRPIITLTLAPEHTTDPSANISFFVSSLSATTAMIQTSAPFSGALIYRAIYAPIYPSFVRRTVLSSSTIYYAAAGYENVGNSSDTYLQYADLAAAPTAFYWSTVDVSSSGTANVIAISSASIVQTSAQLSLSAPLFNELHYLAVVQQ